MFSSIIISGALAQDHEFIYPYYRLLEAESKLDVCLIGGKPVQGFLGTTLPPNKNQKVKDIQEIDVKDYDLLVLPGGVKAMEKIRQEEKLISFISEFHKAEKLLHAYVVVRNYLSQLKLLKERKSQDTIV